MAKSVILSRGGVDSSVSDCAPRTASRSLVAVLFVATMAGIIGKAGGAGLDLSGRELAHSDYRGRDLKGSNLRKADLTMANFAGADLRGADVTEAKLDRINLDGADLRGVIGWTRADLGLGIHANGADFSGTDLRKAKLLGGGSGGYFEKANFTNADLTEATLAGRFHGARFDGAALGGALMLGAGGVESIHDDLRRRGAIVIAADLSAAIKSGRDFSVAILRGSRLQDIDLTGARLEAADLHSANLDRTLLNGADLRQAKLYFASIARSRLAGADLSGASLDNVRAPEASLAAARLFRASLWHANLRGTDLRNADLTGANLSFADLTGADLTGATLDDVVVEAAILDDVQGLNAETYADLRTRAARWRYELREAAGEFLSKWSFPLHLALTPAAVMLGWIGLHSGNTRAAYATLAGANLMATFPGLTRLVFAALGGSPTAQLSAPGLWHAWFDIWPVMMLGLVGLFLASLAMGGYSVVRHVIMPPRHRPILLMLCVLLTAANCFLACYGLLMMAPDA